MRLRIAPARLPGAGSGVLDAGGVPARRLAVARNGIPDRLREQAPEPREVAVPVRSGSAETIGERVELGERSARPVASRRRSSRRSIMALPSLFRRERGREMAIRRESDPVTALRHERARLFEDFGRSFGFDWPAWSGEGWRGFSPSVEVDETDTEVRVTAELPGLEEKNFGLSLDGDILTLRGEKKREHEKERGGWYRSERSCGRFERHIPLPCALKAEDAKAEFRKGVLRVTLPKPPEEQRRSVRILVRGE